MRSIIMGISIFRPIRRKMEIRIKDLLRRMFRKVSLGPIVWIAWIGPMLFSLLLPGS
jgi:hypothetical protein